MALVIYICPSDLKIPETRKRQITYAYQIKRVMKVYALCYTDALAFVQRVFSTIEATWSHMKAVFSQFRMIPVESFRLPYDHKLVRDFNLSRSTQTRRDDVGTEWKDPSNANSHHEFFRQNRIPYDPLDFNSGDIPFNVRFSPSFEWMTKRERSLTGAITYLLSCRRFCKGEVVFDPSLRHVRIHGKAKAVCWQILVLFFCVGLSWWRPFEYALGGVW